MSDMSGLYEGMLERIEKLVTKAAEYEAQDRSEEAKRYQAKLLHAVLARVGAVGARLAAGREIEIVTYNKNVLYLAEPAEGEKAARLCTGQYGGKFVTPEEFFFQVNNEAAHYIFDSIERALRGGLYVKDGEHEREKAIEAALKKL